MVFLDWLSQQNDLHLFLYALLNVLSVDDHMKQTSVVSLRSMMCTSANDLQMQMLGHNMRWSTDLGLGRGYAMNSRRDSAMGTSVADGFPWGVDFMSPGS